MSVIKPTGLGSVFMGDVKIADITSWDVSSEPTEDQPQYPVPYPPEEFSATYEITITWWNRFKLRRALRKLQRGPRTYKVTINTPAKESE